MNNQNQDLLSRMMAAFQGRFRLTAIDVADCPVFLAMAVPLSLGFTGLKPRLPSGRGFTANHAMLSAAGETIELEASLAANCGFLRSRMVSRGGFDFISAADLMTGRNEEIAAQEVFLDYAQVFGEDIRTEADSNGCATGRTLAEATERALLECIERDAAGIWWYGRQPLPHAGTDVLEKTIPRLAWWLSERERVTRLVDITSDIGVPVLAAVSSETDGSRVALGFSAATDVQSAALSAVSEMVQTEISMAMAERANNPELSHWLASASTLTMPQFQPGAAGGTLQEFGKTLVLEKLAARGFRALSIDLTQPNAPAHTVRVIVPGLCNLRRPVNPDRIIAHMTSRSGGLPGPQDFETLTPY
jgi:YcaO-like protein with predicted kinase domain